MFQILIGLFIADLFTAFFHWFEDTYLEYCINIPILSQIAKDNVGLLFPAPVHRFEMERSTMALVKGEVLHYHFRVVAHTPPEPCEGTPFFVGGYGAG